MVKGKGIVISALVAGAASFLSKKENRDKTMKFVNDMKEQYLGSQKQNTYNNQNTNSLEEIAETAAGPSDTKIGENHFISEGGAQTALDYYNEKDQPKQVN